MTKLTQRNIRRFSDGMFIRGAENRSVVVKTLLVLTVMVGMGGGQILMNARLTAVEQRQTAVEESQRKVMWVELQRFQKEHPDLDGLELLGAWAKKLGTYNMAPGNR